MRSQLLKILASGLARAARRASLVDYAPRPTPFAPTMSVLEMLPMS